jgi:MFS family permease
MKKYLFLDAAFEGSRMLPGAVSAAYLMSKGVGLSEIATLKMIQSSVGFFCELPTGVVADHLGRRLSLLMACLFGALAFALYALGNSFPYFAAAEVFLALCLCLWSGAFEAYALESSTEPMAEAEVHKFFHSNSGFNSIGTIAGGALGAFISSYAGFLPFAICAFAMIVLLFTLLFTFPNDNKHQSLTASKLLQAAKHTIRPDTLKNIFSKKHLPLYAILAAGQFVVQPVIYYWQPWFKPWTEGSQQWKLGFIFMAIQGSLLAAGMLGRFLSSRPNLNPVQVQKGAWLVFGVALVLMSTMTSLEASVACLLIAEIGLGVGLAGAKGNLTKVMTSADRASVLSAASLVGRLAGLFSLMTMAGLSYVFKIESQCLQYIFMASGIITLSFLMLNKIKIILGQATIQSQGPQYVITPSNQ